MFGVWISRFTVIVIVLFATEVRSQSDECAEDTCKYRGDCQNTLDGPKCSCQEPFEGNNCELINGERQVTIGSSNEYQTKNCNFRGLSLGEAFFFLTTNHSDNQPGDFYNYEYSRSRKRRSPIDTWSDVGMCRALSPLVIDNEDYNFTLDVTSERGVDRLNQIEYDVGNPGFLFNAKDEDNFDFIIFPIYTDDNRPCYCTGYMENGVVNDEETICHECQARKFKTYQRFYIRGTVNATGVYLDITFTFNGDDPDNFAVKHQPHFEKRGRVGVLMLNEFDEEISFQYVRIEYDATPKFTSISPSYGPISGGTAVTIFGNYIPYVPDYSNPPLVKVGSRRCYTNSSNTKQVVATTPQFNDNMTHLDFPLPENEREPGTPLQVSMLFYNPMVDFAPESLTFTYKPDPVITKYYPKDSIVDGGIDITVEGTNLQSVVTHIMVITMVQMKKEGGVFVTVDTQQFESKCTVMDNTKMSCPTPHIELSGVFVNLTIDSNDLGPQRRRRFVATRLNVDSDFELDAKERIKRDTQTKISDHEISDERLEFYIGFKSDGVLSFTNQTQDNVMTIFANPKFDRFKGDSNMLRYDPYETPRIKIKGKYLRVGARAVDFTVMIGITPCSNLNLTDNEVSCSPPGAEPPNDDTFEALNKVGSATVVVKVGYSEHYIGHMDYTREIDQTTGRGNVPKIFIITLINGLLVVFLIAV